MKKDLFQYIGGFLFALIFLELVLRVSGSLQSNFILDLDTQENSYQDTIFCLGDSFTYGEGISSPVSYPAQLQRILNQMQTPGKTRKFNMINVLNLGRANYNSYIALQRFQELLETITPKAVILLVGGNNFWNALGYDSYAGHKNVWSQARDFIYTMRIYKMVTFILHKKFSKNSSSTQNGAVEQQILAVEQQEDQEELDLDELVDTCLKKMGSNCRQLIMLVNVGDKLVDQAYACNDKGLQCERDKFMENGRTAVLLLTDFLGNRYGPEKLPDNFRHGVMEQTDFNSAYIHLDRALQWALTRINHLSNLGDEKKYYKKIVADILRAMAVFVKRQDKKRSKKYYKKSLMAHLSQEEIAEFTELCILMKQKGLQTDFEEDIKYLRQFKGQVSYLDDFINLFVNFDQYNARIKEWVIADIEKIIRLCNQKQIKLILHSYFTHPSLSSREFKILNPVLKTIAENNSTQFVDHNLLYEKTLPPESDIGKLKDNLFVLDGHPNQKGYAFMAQNIVDKMVELNLIWSQVSSSAR